MLGERWEQSRWADNIWTAKIPNFLDDKKSIRIELEETRGGATDVKISMGEKQVPIDPTMYPTLEDAASAALRAVRQHFQNSRLPAHVLSYTPYRTDRQLKEAFGTVIMCSNNWRKERTMMSRGNVATAVRMMGIYAKVNARGEGEKDRLYLQPAAWDREDLDKGPPV